MRQRREKLPGLLTDVELEFMTALWEAKVGSVRDILSNLAADRGLAYTSAATIMRILEKKGFVSSEKSGKTLVYRPELSKDAYQMRSLKNLSEKLFDNTPESLVARMVDDAGLSQESLEEIRALIDRRLRDASD